MVRKIFQTCKHIHRYRLNIYIHICDSWGYSNRSRPILKPHLLIGSEAYTHGLIKTNDLQENFPALFAILADEC
jgi:hypothetical protein